MIVLNYALQSSGFCELFNTENYPQSMSGVPLAHGLCSLDSWLLLWISTVHFYTMVYTIPRSVDME